VRPRLICVENVGEFAEWGPLCDAGLPIKEQRGDTFRRWCGELRLLGYSVEHRILDASLFGAPTKRKRLFVVARADGVPVEWPSPTHGPGLIPARSAAECIDWSMPCPSIFERKRPLAEKTLWRVAQGIKRYVLGSPYPFIVRGVVSPTLVQTGYGERKGQRPRSLDIHEPLGTVVAGGSKHALVSAFISRYYGGSRPVVAKELSAPLPTVTAWDHNSLAAVTLAKFRGTHIAEVRAMLERLDVPGPHRVMVDGVPHVIADIGLRMLEPHELLLAQFGDFASGYDMSAAATKSAKIRLIGNSVCPVLAEAVVRSNTAKAREVAA
jgi:DNA (cytosine-5)-methyltransferase 1